MPRIFYVHWNRDEALARSRTLHAAGHEVLCHFDGEKTVPKFQDSPPDVVVISLERLPSHGRAIAEWFWEAKKRRATPIIFVGGQPDKIAKMRERFPTAIFCNADELPETLGAQKRKPL